VTVVCLGVAVEQRHYGHCNHYLLTTLKVDSQVRIDETPEDSYGSHYTVTPHDSISVSHHLTTSCLGLGNLRLSRLNTKICEGLPAKG
jgi:hypothetical protein